MTSLVQNAPGLFLDHTGRVEFSTNETDPGVRKTPSVDVFDASGALVAVIFVEDIDAAEALADAVATMLEHHRDRSAQRLAAVGPPVTAAGKRASVQAIEGRWS